MSKSTDSENVRLLNLRELHGKLPGYGAPTSKYLVKFLNDNGVLLTENELTKIYQNTKVISDTLAKEIEQAFGLQPGWLSEDHGFIFKLSPDQLNSHRALSGIPPKIRDSLYALIQALTNP